MTPAEAAMTSAPEPQRLLPAGRERELPHVALPVAPDSLRLWTRAMVAALVGLGLFFLDRLSFLLSDLWLLRSLKLESVFWTNFRMGAILFAAACAGNLLAIGGPALAQPISRGARRLTLLIAVFGALLSGYWLALEYPQFLVLSGPPFGKLDPVFGYDIGFYVFTLPCLWIIWQYATLGSLWGLCAAAVCSYLAERRSAPTQTGERAGATLAMISTRTTRIALAQFGVLGAIGVWLSRYNLLLRDNYDASVWVGASYIDVVGLFSNLNYITVTTAVMLADDLVIILILSLMWRTHKQRDNAPSRSPIKLLVGSLVLLFCIDLTFKLFVEARNVLFVKPNEPVIQLDFIRQHIAATRAAYKLDRIPEIPFVPNGPGDPIPDIDRVLASAAVRNIPLWPGFTSWLEHFGDYQHSRRVLQTQGDTMVYGPTREIFQQQQKLRAYYDFMGVDSVRYKIGDETQMFVSAVRELPLWEPEPWLAYWGNQFMLFTHGHGLVMAPAAAVDFDGSPVYVSKEIPSEAKYPELTAANQRVYYGEGSATMCFSNVKNLKELDYPTEQDRAEVWLPEDVDAGVHLDSLAKRLVFGWRSGQFFEVVFSDLITDRTRAHYLRTPLERLERVAPFLYYDSNPYAVVADGKIVWMVNGITTSDSYPYSFYEELGDKSDERSKRRRPELPMNYMEDSVKATVDAYTGAVTFYRISDDPVVSAWAEVYPDLFTPADRMPASVRAQLTYPLQFFHTQFDDLYQYYHMNDPIYFFNQEDVWDDADEVLGPMMDEGKAVTFSFEPYNLMVETGGLLPTAKTRTQFALVMPFTPLGALNLRAIPIAYQDGEDYGKLSVLAVPKGHYVIGPEQVDAAVDQVPEISQQFAWWTRRGMEVIRGHTTLVFVDREVLYVEPIFLRSKQNPVPQLKKVVVTFRGKPAMEDSVEQALRKAVAGYESDLRPGSRDGRPQVVSAPSAS